MPTHIFQLHGQKPYSLPLLAKAINDPSLVATVLFCLVGLVITAFLIFCFPDLGAVMAQYNQL
jgi:hypothetical protein